MPKPKLPLILLLASFGLGTGCTSLTTQPTEGGSTLTVENEELLSEDANEDAVAAPLPHVELSPRLLYRLLVADFAAETGEQRLAAEQYLHSASETRDPRLAKRAARLAMYNNDAGLALQAAILWSELAPDDSEADQVIAAIYIGSGRGSEARSHLEQIIASPAMKPGHGYLVVASLLGRAPDKQEALALMKALMAGHENEATPLYAYASLAAQQENPAVALQSLEQLLKIEPGHLQGLLLKSRLLHAQERRVEALTTLAEAVKQAPDNAQLRLIYARMLVDERRLDDARREFQRLNRQNPDNPDALYALGLLAMQADAIDEGEKYFQRLLQLEERVPEANYALGQIAEGRKQYDRAIEFYGAVDSGENLLDARLRVALLTARREGLDKARDYLHTLTPDTGADTVRIALFESELLREAGNDGEAMHVYNDAIVLVPDNPELLYARAMVAERLNRLDILEEDLRAILRQNPNHAQALNALGYTLADRTQRYQEAYELVSKAHQLDPNDTAILDSMGWVLYRLGRHEEALTYLKQAMRQQADPEIAAHLGEVLWVSDKQKEARKVWGEARKQWPNHTLLRQTIERLAQ